MMMPKRLLAIALAATLLVTVGPNSLRAGDDPAGEQEQLNAKVLSLLNQDDALDAALKNAKVAIPDLSKVTKELADPLVKGTLIAVLEKELRDHPGVKPKQLQATARDKAVALLRFLTRKPDLNLSADDQVFADYLAARTFVSSHLAKTAGERTARTLVPRGEAAVPADISDVIDEAVAPAQAPGGGAPAGQTGGAPTGQAGGAPAGQTGGAPAGQTGGAAQPQAAAAAQLPDLISGTTRDQLVKMLQKAKNQIAQTIQTNEGDTPDDSIVKARLNSFVRISPDDNGAFLKRLAKLSKETIHSFDDLSNDDQREVSKMIDEAMGTPASTKPTNKAQQDQQQQQPDLGVELGDAAVSILGDIFPAFAPFEGLADDAVGVLVPALERWQPLQRCRARMATMGAGGGLLGTGGGLLGTGGGLLGTGGGLLGTRAVYPVYIDGN